MKRVGMIFLLLGALGALVVWSNVSAGLSVPVVQLTSPKTVKFTYYPPADAQLIEYQKKRGDNVYVLYQDDPPFVNTLRVPEDTTNGPNIDTVWWHQSTDEYYVKVLLSDGSRTVYGPLQVLPQPTATPRPTATPIRISLPIIQR